jgi:hypothetical protein
MTISYNRFRLHEVTFLVILMLLTLNLKLQEEFLRHLLPKHVRDRNEINRAWQMAQRENARARLRKVLELRTEPFEFLNRVASLILAVMYSSEHIEISVLSPMPAGKASQKNLSKRLDEVQQSVGDVKRAYEAHRATKYSSLLYTVSTTKAKQAESSSEIGTDTVAVTIMNNNLYVARNFKKRSIENEKVAINPTLKYSFGKIPDVTQSRIMNLLRTELADSGVYLDRVYFLRPMLLDLTTNIASPPDNARDNAKPHAEMQLLKYFSNFGQQQGLMVGVSKSVCRSCAEQLQKKGARFHKDIGHLKVENWVPPEELIVRIESSHPVSVSRPPARD